MSGLDWDTLKEICLGQLGMNHEEFWNSTLRQIDERLRARLKQKQREIEEQYSAQAFLLAGMYNMQRKKGSKAVTSEDFFNVEEYRKSVSERAEKAQKSVNGKPSNWVPRKEQQKTLAELKSILG